MNTAHREASRQKRASPSKFWIRSITPETQTTLSVVHWDNLTSMTHGKADAEVLWDWIGCGHTYQRIAHLLAEEGIEITTEAHAALTEQLATHATVLERFRRTGRVGFDAQEYLAAKAACAVMDELATLDRNGAALRAALWSETQVTRMRARFEA